MSDPRVAALSDVLHRGLAAQPICWLLLDPAVRPLSPDSALMQALLPGELLTVPSRHCELDESMMPRLVALDSSNSIGSEALQTILSLALTELDPLALQAGQGRQIGACWQCAAPADPTDQKEQLRQHLSRSLLQTRETHTVLLRWVDPAVLWGLWPVLNDTQRTTLLGPIQTIWLLDPVGQWMCLQRPERSADVVPPTTALSLSAEQWREVDHLSALNAALRHTPLPGGADASARLTAMRAQAMHALRRAHDYGIHDAQDLIVFARLSLQVHPQFDRHPLIQARLQCADDYFSARVDDLTSEQWQGIKIDCASTERTAHTELV